MTLRLSRHALICVTVLLYILGGPLSAAGYPLPSKVAVRACLFTIAQAAKKKAHAEDEQQVRQDGAKERCLDDSTLVLLQGGQRRPAWMGA